MKAKSTLRRHLAIVVAIGLGCTLMILSMATLVAAGGGTPTVNGLFYGDGDDSNYYFLGEDPGRGKLYYNRVGDTLYLAVVVSDSVNDNVFGTKQDDGPYMTSADWTAVHVADRLIGSDHVQLTLQCGANSWTWNHGYLYDADGDEVPSEADWLSGPGDGSIGGGTPPPGLVSASSLQWNMNNTTWDVTLGGTRSGSSKWKSVDGDNDNDVTDEGWPTYNSTYDWEWAMVYEMSMNVSACGNDDITVSVPSAHNSPSKDGNEDVPICSPDPCSLPASIGNYVWVDDNGDGIQDAGESGLDGVTVKLYDSSHNLKGTTTTSGGGFYSFTNLTPGDYYVEFVEPTDYDFADQDQGSDDAVDSDADTTTGKTVVTTLVSGESDLTWDAGLEYTGDPTAVTLSSFAANSSAGGAVNPLWLGLAGLTVLAAGSLFWVKRRGG